MEINKISIIVLTVFISILLLCVIFYSNPIIIKIEFINSTEEYSNLDKCYLTIHNFVSIHQKNGIKYSNDSIDFKTFIYSYTRPYLLELINNTTNDCICCS